MTESPRFRPLAVGVPLRQHLLERQQRLREIGIEPSVGSVLAVARLDKTTSPRPRNGRAPRSAGARRRGSRRGTGSRSPPNGDDDPEPPARVCGGCDKPLIGYAPQARYHGDACRMRARRKAAKSSRPTWAEPDIVAIALRIEPRAVLAELMAEPPHGALTEAVAA